MENYAALGYLLSQSKETAQDVHQGLSKSLYLRGIQSEGGRGECRKKIVPSELHTRPTFAWFLE